MAQIINNVDLDKIAQTTANGQKDRLTLKKPVKLQGEWILNTARGYQFSEVRIKVPYRVK